MASQGNGRGLPATRSGPTAGDSPLGLAGKDCICFPPDEPPDLELKAEIEAARATSLPAARRAFQQAGAENLPGAALCFDQSISNPEAWLARYSPQYLKALRASFPPDCWPATELTEPDGAVRFVLKDGAEIHRTGPPREIYDYQTGKLVGWAGPRGRFVPLEADSAAAGASRSKMDDVEILDTNASSLRWQAVQQTEFAFLVSAT